MFKRDIFTFFTLLLLRLPVGHGGVVNSPRFCFFLFVNVESWATARG